MCASANLKCLQSSEVKERRRDEQRENPNGGNDGIGALLGDPRTQREHDGHVTIARNGRERQH